MAAFGIPRAVVGDVLEDISKAGLPLHDVYAQVLRLTQTGGFRAQDAASIEVQLGLIEQRVDQIRECIAAQESPEADPEAWAFE